MAETGLSQLVRCEWRHHRTTGVARDDQINVLFFGTDTETRADLITASANFLNIVSNAIDQWMSEELFVETLGETLTFFDMLQPEPRQPVDVIMNSPACVSAQSLPEEVSMCVSFEAVPVSGQSQRQRRGRIYLPTFIAAALDQDSSVKWDSSPMVDVTTAFSAAKVAILGDSCSLGVFSRVAAAAAGGTLLNQARAGMTYIVGGWVDNEPDTQRRRGRAGGTKSIWS